MSEKSISDLHRELVQMQQETKRRAFAPAQAAGKHPMFDLGFLLLAYLFWLIVVSNLLLLSGVTISLFNCLFAVPFAWATLWIARGTKPLYSLLVTLVAAMVIFLCAYAVTFIYDFSWDGNWYHKVDIGLLKWGWNPFQESMGDFANRSGIITTTTDWPVWFDGYPKGTYTIGACFYALFGTIEAGKCHNLIGMIALICIGSSLIRSLGKLKRWQAFSIAFLLAVNPISLMKAISFYNDGFMTAMLTVFGLSLCYLYLHERGRLSIPCWVLVFLSLSIGLNTKFSGLVFFGMLGILFYFFWIYSHIRKHGIKNTGPFAGRITLLFLLAVLCAVVLAGATTYIVNLLRYQNPLYSVVGQDATPLADQEMPAYLWEFPRIVQFFYSIFSRATNEIYLATGNHLKIPFTISPEEWGYAASIDTRSSGWGIVFSGAFVISIVVYAAALIVAARNRIKRNRVRLLLLVLLYIFIPPFFIAGLWWGRYYMQLYWLPAAALCILFTLGPRLRQAGKRLRAAGAALLSAVIIGILLFNLVPCIRYYQNQITATRDAKAVLNRMKLLHRVYPYRLTFYNDQFYGLLFNIIDKKIDYGMAAEGGDYDIVETAVLYSYVTCDAVRKESGEAEPAGEFLASLQVDLENKCILIAVSDEASQGLNPETVQAMRALGLAFDLEGKFHYSYAAAVDSGVVLFEQASPDVLDIDCEIGPHRVTLVSAGYNAGPDALIFIDGLDVSLNRRGLNIAVYDKTTDEITDVVAIDTYLDNSLSR